MGMNPKTPSRNGLVLAVLAAMVLSGCQSDSPPKKAEADVPNDSFGIGSLISTFQSAPDEFSVVTKKPLELPDSFAALPVPEPGKISTRDPNPGLDARAALQFDTGVAASSAPSATEAAILSAAGPSDPNIRALVAQEQLDDDSNQDLYVLDRIFPSLRELRGEASRNALDAEAERLRLLEEGVIPRVGLSAVPAPTAPDVAVPQPVRSVTAPALPAPPVYAPAQAGSVAPVPAPSVAAPAAPSAPTFGVLSPEIAPAPGPELIYIPE